MTDKVNHVVAGIFVCAVSSTVVVSTSADASQSVKVENRSEEVMKEFSGNESSVISAEIKEKLQIIIPATNVAAKKKPGRKRHKIVIIKNVVDWWDTLWAKTDPAAKQDKYFS
jgi:hypothetical protein